jgi:anti-sigma factor RsiW
MEHQSCRHLLGSLSDYVDGELESELCAEIDRHLQGCERCRIVIDTLRKTVYLYHEGNSEVEVPSDVRERLFSRLDLDDFLNRK